VLKLNLCYRVLQVLRAAQLPDCAAAYVQACQEAGLLIPTVRQGSNPLGRDADDPFDQQAAVGDVELFDILGLRTRMLMQSSSRAAPHATSGAGEASSGAELVQVITSEWHQYLCGLVNSL
jgi:hypothetical protein